jgi:hypothetical protein
LYFALPLDKTTPCEVQSWGLLDYTVGAAKRVSAELDFHAAREGTAHGVCLWFETKLFEGIGYSSGPGDSATIYGQLFLPWLEPVAVDKGQRIQLGLHADLIGQDYIWRWETRVSATANHAEIHFHQSTFQGANFSPQSLRNQAVNHVPLLSEAGKADRWMLEKMEGSVSLGEIAQSALGVPASVFFSPRSIQPRGGSFQGILALKRLAHTEPLPKYRGARRAG